MTDNLAIWNALSKTDPKHTKQFKRAGGFSGTAIKPMWIVHKLTAQFGPVGEGWGMGKPDFQVVPGNNGEMLVYCTVECWHGSPERKLYGVGGDKIVTYIKANEQYKRPERWENDDEAFKKAFTDAVGNAFKFVGVGADVHMGQFDDSKYVQQVAREYAEQAQGKGQSQQGAVSPSPTSPHTGEPVNDGPAKRGLDGPHTSKAALFAAFTALQTDVMRCGDDDSLICLMADEGSKAVIAQCERDAPHYLHGGDPAPDDFEPLFTRIQRMRDEWQMEKAA